jgi:hypothetical protein
MGGIEMITHSHSTKAGTGGEFSGTLQDLVIVGGGIGGTSAAEALAACIEKEQREITAGRLPPEHARFSGISEVSLLLGGSSLAFAPPAGEFAEYLTLAGTDTIRRDHKLFEQQNRAERLFKDHGFNVRQNTIAQKVSMTDHEFFSIQAVQNGRAYFIEAKKMIFALGHSLRETPTELRTHIIRGTGDLCQRLCAFHQAAAPRHHALDKFLSQFKPMEDGIIRIGLVGFGASCVEAIKIFHSLLAPPSHTRPYFHTVCSGTPVQFTIIDSGLARFYGSKSIHLLEYLQICHQKVEGSDEPGSLLTKRDEELHKQAVRMRIADLLASNQLQVVGSRLDWENVRLHDGLLQVPLAGASRESFSCVIDCAPFITGIGPKHRDIISELPVLTFTPYSDQAWHVQLSNESYRSLVGLVGAAFHPPRDWDAGAIFKQALQTICDLFPLKPERSTSLS